MLMINSVTKPINQTISNNWSNDINVEANLSNSSNSYKFDYLPLIQSQPSNIYSTTTPSQMHQTQHHASVLFDFSTDLGKTEHSSHRIPSMRNFLIVIYTLFTICGATFNLILIFALLKFRKQTLSHNITNLFVLCLAVSDIFLCSVSMPIQLYYEITEHHKPSTDLCRVLFSSFGIPMYISCLTILLIAFDRYRLIVYPLKTQLTPKAALGLISIVIIFSVLNSIPVALQVNSEGVNDYRYCVETWPSPQLRFAYSVSMFVILVLLPLSASGGFYLAIYRRLKLRPCQLNASKEAEKRKKRTTSLLVITVVCFAVCWTPWCLYSLLLEVQALLSVENDLSPNSRFDLSKFNQLLFNSNEHTVSDNHDENYKDETSSFSTGLKTCEEFLWYTMNQSSLLLMDMKNNQNSSTVDASTNLLKPKMNIIPGKHLKIIDLLLKLFAMGSACVNPLLYGWLNEPIRIVMRRQYSRFKECFKQFQGSERINNNNNHNHNNNDTKHELYSKQRTSDCFQKHRSSNFLKPSNFVKSNSDYDTRPKLIIERPTGSRQTNSQDIRSASYTEGVTDVNKTSNRIENTYNPDTTHNQINNDNIIRSDRDSNEFILPKRKDSGMQKQISNHYELIDNT